MKRLKSLRQNSIENISMCFSLVMARFYAIQEEERSLYNGDLKIAA